LESVTAGTYGIDTVPVNEHLMLFRQNAIRPHVVYGDRHFGSIHFVDLNHIRIVITHLNVAAIF